MIKNIIIVDNLVNDYCGLEERFFKNNVHIGWLEAESLFGEFESQEVGPIPSFLSFQKSQASSHVIYIRDCYDEKELFDRDHLERLGNHCIKDTEGAELVTSIKNNVEPNRIIDHQGLSFPLEAFNKELTTFANVDLFDFRKRTTTNDHIKFLILGFHTERRVFSLANILRNFYGFREVAVFSHFLSSANKEAHFNALQYQFPDNLIQVIYNTDRLADYLNQDLSFLDRYELNSVKIGPQEAASDLNKHQKNIIESICMNWTNAELKQLSTGYSNSKIFLAEGKRY
ncbi:MAG: hypothetical protein AAFO07_21630, partial [Bacteroidota bacterium]